MIWCDYKERGAPCNFRVDSFTMEEAVDAHSRIRKDCPGDLQDDVEERKHWNDAYELATAVNKAVQAESAVWNKLHPPRSPEAQRGVASETITEAQAAWVFAQIIIWQQKLVALNFALEGINARGMSSNNPYLDAAIGSIHGWIYESINRLTLQLLAAGTIGKRAKLLAIPAARRLIRAHVESAAYFQSNITPGATPPEKWIWNGWEQALDSELAHAKKEYEDINHAVRSEATARRAASSDVE